MSLACRGTDCIEKSCDLVSKHASGAASTASIEKSTALHSLLRGVKIDESRRVAQTRALRE